MRCQDVQDWLADKPDEAEWARDVEAHLSSCPECARVGRRLRLLKRGAELLRQETAPEVSPYFWTRLRARLEAESSREHAGEAVFVWVGRRVVYSGAILALLLGLGLLLHSTSSLQTPSVVEAFYLAPPEVERSNLMELDQTSAGALGWMERLAPSENETGGDER